ncbi:Na/Pi cotransporter family protein [Bullifex porci]|uniref:Na/Pi cotransporter family protein n=1 Tax=Bullifex porci TaxID=2606638 RepID=UPI0023EF611F|nr:Na/Pi cotransporter family protein [Bullifex porci]MDD7255335.1 Na/Pi cotransporter family protein [Bullifex porci]MDY2740698.1 Na/Pi cotransporter family protein [Bullifex porci]
MDFVDALTLLGGVALFLFGMTLMGDALKLVAGNKLELILYRLSGTPIKGILLGTGVTAVIQSSSATSVMVVGFVNSGMMKINQAISIIMGAIIGTSVTGWIISLSDISGGGGILSLFSTEVLSAITAIIGIYLRMFNKERNKQHIGDILLGFSILMFGMKSMSSSVSDLRNSEVFINLLTKFTNPFLGILIGLIFTTIIQSASAAIGILQALSATGAITFEIALPIIMGIAIGAAVPVLLSAFGATVEGKRTAVSYLVVDFLGSLIFSIIFYSLNFFFHFSFMSTPLRSVNIALINTVFRVAIVLILMPSINIIENLISMLIKDEAVSSEAELDEINSLEERFISYPPLAVENSKLAIRKMGELTLKNIYDALDLLVLSYSDDGYKEVERIENIIDKYEDKIGTYLTKVAVRELPSDLNRSVTKFLHTLTDYERISDHALNLAQSAKEIKDKNITFTSDAIREIRNITGALKRILAMVVEAFNNNDIELAYKIEPLEEIIDELCIKMKANHIARLTSGNCTLLNGYIYNDMVGDFERISDHCSNIAATMIEMEGGVLGIHTYTNDIKSRHTHNYEENYRKFKNEFNLMTT